mmetsp:Transcript_3262/g.7081  ORF Transcript_3262/g.7081 Transcript_3262/m.7081 type:complete len:91 (+) Transcript_3262:394-666(+)
MKRMLRLLETLVMEKKKVCGLFTMKTTDSEFKNNPCLKLEVKICVLKQSCRNSPSGADARLKNDAITKEAFFSLFRPNASLNSIVLLCVE